MPKAAKPCYHLLLLNLKKKKNGRKNQGTVAGFSQNLERRLIDDNG